jgi:hypothetical protein
MASKMQLLARLLHVLLPPIAQCLTQSCYAGEQWHMSHPLVLAATACIEQQTLCTRAPNLPPPNLKVCAQHIEWLSSNVAFWIILLLCLSMLLTVIHRACGRAQLDHLEHQYLCKFFVSILGHL